MKIDGIQGNAHYFVCVELPILRCYRPELIANRMKVS
jgi:hypothetical protein